MLLICINIFGKTSYFFEKTNSKCTTEAIYLLPITQFLLKIKWCVFESTFVCD